VNVELVKIGDLVPASRGWPRMKFSAMIKACASPFGAGWLPLGGVVGDELEYEAALCRGLLNGRRLVFRGRRIDVNALNERFRS
jgi:hypothetical protein